MNELRTRKVRDIIATENNLLDLRPGDSILGVKNMSHFIGRSCCRYIEHDLPGDPSPE